MNTYLNLQARRRPLQLLDEPRGCISAMARANLGHQMRYSADLLEGQLAEAGAPRILQLATQGDQRNPGFWRLFANGNLVASGTGDYARQCFEEGPRVFLDKLREAVEASSHPLSPSSFEVLSMARSIAAIEHETTSGKQQTA